MRKSHPWIKVSSMNVIHGRENLIHGWHPKMMMTDDGHGQSHILANTSLRNMICTSNERLYSIWWIKLILVFALNKAEHAPALIQDFLQFMQHFFLYFSMFVTLSWYLIQTSFLCPSLSECMRVYVHHKYIIMLVTPSKSSTVPRLGISQKVRTS